MIYCSNSPCFYGRGRLQTKCFDLAQVKELKEIISKDLRFPLDRLKLVKGGKALDDDPKAVGLLDGGVITSRLLAHVCAAGCCALMPQSPLH